MLLDDSDAVSKVQ